LTKRFKPPVSDCSSLPAEYTLFSHSPSAIRLISFIPPHHHHHYQHTHTHTQENETKQRPLGLLQNWLVYEHVGKTS
jgi:hypothetical protein